VERESAELERTDRLLSRQAGLDAVRQQNADETLLIGRCLMFTHPLYILPFSRPFKTLPAEVHSGVPVRKRSGTQYSRTITSCAFHDAKR